MEDQIRHVMEDFIEIYRSEPCLWMVESKDYHDRNKKQAAYNKLILKLKEIEPNADRQKVIKKINSMRTAFRKELKKQNNSKASGAGIADIYVPKLWYFESMYFIEDQCKVRESVTNISESDSETQNSESHLNSAEEDSPENGLESQSEENTQNSNAVESHADITQTSDDVVATTSQTPSVAHNTPSRSKKRSKTDIANEVLVTVNEHFKRPRESVTEDRFDIFGKTVAIKLRDSEKIQRLLAEKLINEVLFEAEMGNLTRSHQFTSAMQPTNLQQDQSVASLQTYNGTDPDIHGYRSTVGSFLSGYIPL